MTEKVLIVDDSMSMRCLLENFLLSAGYQVIAVANGLEAISILQEEGSPALVLLDRILPGMSGDQVCLWVRENNKSYNYKYLIMLTTKIDQDQILEGFGLGADDYITKPFNEKELLARLSVGKRIISLQRDLWNAAIRDSLTGLYNRRAVNELLAIEMGRASREQSLVAIAMADIDHFKRINDKYGHTVGDEVIVTVADIMKNSLRNFDIIGRFGGEEFIFAFDCRDISVVVQVCERVRAEVVRKPLTCGGFEETITVSIGVTIIDGTADYTEGIMRADSALYQSKQRGRNRVSLYGE